jgi:hypothetical protein
MSKPRLTAGSRPAEGARLSAHSLHTVSAEDHHNSSHNHDGSDDDVASISSSRSDQSLEAAGLVARSSDEYERANRHARYEGGGTRLGSTATTEARTYRMSEDEEGETSRDIDNPREGNHDGAREINAPRDRSSTDRRRSSRKKDSLLLQAWQISREVSKEMFCSKI